jgi:hypothetical protein
MHVARFRLPAVKAVRVMSVVLIRVSMILGNA